MPASCSSARAARSEAFVTTHPKVAPPAPAPLRRRAKAYRRLQDGHPRLLHTPHAGCSRRVRFPPHPALALPPLPGWAPAPPLPLPLPGLQRCWQLWRGNSRCNPTSDLPGPRPKWLVGNLSEVMHEGQETATARWCRWYGPGPWVYWLGGVPIVTTDDPQTARWAVAATAWGQERLHVGLPASLHLHRMG